MKEKNILTYKTILKRIGEKQPEELTKDLFTQRYLIYGTDQELKQPDIQKLCLKHNLVEELTDVVVLIEDKEVIKQILQSKIFNQKRKIKRGKIKEILFENLNDMENVKISKLIFIRTDGETMQLNGHLFSKQADMEEYQKELSACKDDLFVIYEDYKCETYLRCFLKTYPDITYNPLS